MEQVWQFEVVSIKLRTFTLRTSTLGTLVIRLALTLEKRKVSHDFGGGLLVRLPLAFAFFAPAILRSYGVMRCRVANFSACLLTSSPAPATPWLPPGMMINSDSTPSDASF